jgi:hypothetical protein
MWDYRGPLNQFDVIEVASKMKTGQGMSGWGTTTLYVG